MKSFVAVLSGSFAVAILAWWLSSLLLRHPIFTRKTFLRLNFIPRKQMSALFWFTQSNIASWMDRRQARKKIHQLTELFPQALGMAIQALKTGQTMPQVLDYLSQES